MSQSEIETILTKAFSAIRARSKIVKSISKSAEMGECLQGLNNDFDRAAQSADIDSNAAVASAAVADAATGGTGTVLAIIGLAIVEMGIDAHYEAAITNAIADYEDCIRTNCSKRKRPLKY